MVTEKCETHVVKSEHSAALAARATLIRFWKKNSRSELGDVQLLLGCWAVTLTVFNIWQEPVELPKLQGPGQSAGVVSQKTLLLTKLLCRVLETIALCSSLLICSTLLLQQVLVFGVVGAFDWSGGILLYHLATRTALFLNESKEEAKKAKYSYLCNKLTPLWDQMTTWLQFCIVCLCSVQYDDTDSVYWRRPRPAASYSILNIFFSRERDSDENTFCLLILEDTTCFLLWVMMPCGIILLTHAIWFHCVRILAMKGIFESW